MGRGHTVRTVEEQLALVTAAAVAPRPVRVAISEAQGLLCAEEVVAERPLPSFDQAAIDGYAVRAVDVKVGGTADDEGGGPRASATLPVVGRSPPVPARPPASSPVSASAWTPAGRCPRWPMPFCPWAGPRPSRASASARPARSRPASTCDGWATTSSRVMWPYAPEASSVPPR